MNIPIIQQTNITMPDTTAYLILSNPAKTTIGGPTVETLTIQNDIENFTLANPDYFVSEGSRLCDNQHPPQRSDQRHRLGGIHHSSPRPMPTAQTAMPFPDSITARPTAVLTFQPGQTLQTIPIAIFQQTTVDGPETFQVVLTNASPGTQIGSPGAAVITIIGDVTGFRTGHQCLHDG